MAVCDDRLLHPLGRFPWHQPPSETTQNWCLRRDHVTCVFSVIIYTTKKKGKNQAEKLRQKNIDYSFVIQGIHWRRKVIWVNFESIIYQFREGSSFTHWKKNRTVQTFPEHQRNISKKTQQRSGDCLGVAKPLVHSGYIFCRYAVGNPLNLRKRDTSQMRSHSPNFR